MTRPSSDPATRSASIARLPELGRSISARSARPEDSWSFARCWSPTEARSRSGSSGRRPTPGCRASPSTPTPTPTALFVSLADEAYALGGATPAETYLDVAKILEIAAQKRGQRRSSGVRIPGRERGLRPGGDRCRADLDRSTAGGDRGARRQGQGAAHRPAGRRAAGARHRRPGGRRGGGGGVRRGARAADRDQGGVRRRRPRSEGGPDDGRDPVALRVGDPRGRDGVRPRRVLRRALPGQAATRRDPVPGRHPRQRRGRLDPGLLAAAAHQKLVEEAPAPFLSAEQTERLYSASKAILPRPATSAPGRASSWSARTARSRFLEVNTRLQVEHPVSEEVTGLDLVREMFRIAEGRGPRLRRPTGHRALHRVPDQRRGRRPQLHAGPGHLDQLAAPVRTRGTGRRGLPGRDDRAGQLRLPGGQDHRHRRRPYAGPGPLPAGPARAGGRGHADRDAVPPGGARRPGLHRRRRHFGVHTRWIETEFGGEIPPYAGRPWRPRVEPVASRRSWSRSTGKRLEVSLPAGLGAVPTAAPSRPARPEARRARRRLREGAVGQRADLADAGHDRQGRGSRRGQWCRPATWWWCWRR